MSEPAVPPSKSRARRGAGAALAIALTTGAMTLVAAPATVVTGCQDRNCEFSARDFGRGPTEGRLIGPDTWESASNEEEWLDYPGQRIYYVYPRLYGRRIARVTVFISPTPRPYEFPSQYTTASGNVAIVRHFGDPGNPANPGLAITNNTCAQFYARFVVDAYPISTDVTDAGDAGDSSADATSDVSLTEAGVDSAAANDGASE